MVQKRIKALGQALLVQMFLYLTENMVLLAIVDQNLRLLLSIPLTLTVFIVPSLLYRHKTGYTPFVSYLFPEANSQGNTADSAHRNDQKTKTIFLFIFALCLTVTAVNIFGILSDSIFSILGYERVQAALPESKLVLAASFIRSVIIAAFCEEILFRGAVLNAFGDTDKLKTIFVSAVLFALMHYNITQTLYAFAAGLIIAFFALKTRSLTFALLLHIGSNLITFIFTVLQSLLPVEKYQKISLISAFCFALISIVGLVIKIIRFKRPEKEIKKPRENIAVSLGPELVVYAILALVLSMLNITQ